MSNTIKKIVYIVLESFKLNLLTKKLWKRNYPKSQKEGSKTGGTARKNRSGLRCQSSDANFLK